MYRFYSHIISFILILNTLQGQSDTVFVSSIHITGNNKTKANVILRELDISVLDSIPTIQLPARLDENEKRILSTGLFSEVDINIKTWDQNQQMVDLMISVKEGWYLYPYLILELADRNFNVWAKDFNYSFQRLNYGVAMTQVNFTGNKDKLKAKLQFGFTGKYEVYYELPYLKKGWGFTANFSYAYNKEISYKTFENRPLFIKSPDERNLLKQYRTSVAITHRKNAFVFQSARVQYFYGKVDTMISGRLNTNYFLNAEPKLNLIRLEYEWVKNKLVYPLYPEGGFRWAVNVKKDGFGESDYNNTQIFSSFEKHWKFSNSWIISSSLKCKANIQRKKIPYFYNQALGYEGDQITGYQLYVVDGTDFIYLKNALKWKVFYKNFPLRNWMPRRFNPFNTQIFLRANLDAAYVNEPDFRKDNPLANTLLLGYGVAVDLIMFHNLVISSDFSLNRQGDFGLFFSGGFQF